MGTKDHSSLGIRRIASLHLFVRDLERTRDHYVNRLDFAQVAVSGARFENEQRARASVLEAGGVRLVLFEPLGCRGESFQWLRKHPEGVGRVVLEVTDVESAYRTLKARGATVVDGLHTQKYEHGMVAWFDLATPIGDTQLRFVQYDGATPIMEGLERVGAGAGTNHFRVREVDHVTCNFLTLAPAALWMEHVLGLQRYWGIEFHTQDLAEDAKSGSGLRSMVMWDPESGLKFACNEPVGPFYEASQIYTFCQQHHGPGVQHVAFAVEDIAHAVRGMRARGIEFMSTPSAYFDRLPARLRAHGVHELDEELATLRELQILVDANAHRGYLLQIFLRDAAALFRDPQAGPLFIELIQRCGDEGFGAGNFRALFESIEREQYADAC